MDLLTAFDSTATAPFDYGALPAEQASAQRERAERIRGMYRQTVETAGEIGRELLAAQAELEHGQFLTWVTEAVGLSKSTAYRCMDMARSFGPKLPVLGSLPLAVVHKLAEKGTPEPVRASVLRRIEAGETIRAEMIFDEVREAREAAKIEATADKERVRRAKLTAEQRADEDALRAKGEKGKAARERLKQRERDDRREEERLRAAHVAEAAGILVDMIGAEKVATFSDRFEDVLYEVYREAENEAHRRRARRVAPDNLPASDIHRSGALYGHTSEDDRPRIEALAAEIERDGLKEPPIVVRRERDKFHPFHVLEGMDTLRALAEVLRWETIPVRVAPPVRDVPLTAPVSGKPERPIIGVRSAAASAPGDHFGTLRHLRRPPSSPSST